MEPRSHFITIDGVSLHVADWGGGGPEILLLHANGFLGSVYRLLIQHLTDRYHVRTMDLRGQGDSEKLATLEHYDWRYVARDIEGVIEHLGLQGFYGIGHSGGAALLALYAATHPCRVKSLVLIEPVTLPHEPEFLTRLAPDQNPLIQQSRRRRIIWESREQLFSSYRGRGIFAAWREEALWDYVNHGTYDLPDGHIALKCSAEVEAQGFINATKLNIFAQLDTIDCPVMVMRGAQTDAPLFVVAERVAQRIPQGSLVTVPDTGHLLPMEQPEKVGDIIGEFFRSGTARPTNTRQ